MSALRISRPGTVGTTLIDLGPAVGRTIHTRGPVIVHGEYVVAESERARKTRLQREAMRASRAKS